MGLDVEVPDPPQLTNRGLPAGLLTDEAVTGPNELHREELEAILADGAWTEAFEEWAAYTDLTEPEYELVVDLGLVASLDVFWDPVAAALDYEVPTVPDDWDRPTDRTPTPSDPLVAKLETELADLGQTVVEMLADGYVDWGETGPTDVVWDEETFGHELPE